MHPWDQTITPGAIGQDIYITAEWHPAQSAASRWNVTKGRPISTRRLSSRFHFKPANHTRRINRKVQTNHKVRTNHMLRKPTETRDKTTSDSWWRKVENRQFTQCLRVQKHHTRVEKQAL